MHLLQVLPVVAGLAAALPTEGIQARQTTTVPTGVTVSSVTFSGSGCPAENIASFAVPNAGTIPIKRYIFKTATGVNNTRAAETRLNCQSTINVSHPAGWQYALVKADYYGRVKLPQGAEATSKSTYSFVGDAASAAKSSQYYFDGPFDGLYFRNDRYTGTARTWSKCGTGAGLVIDTEVRVAPIGTAVVNKEVSMEAYVFHGNQLGIEWRKC